MKTNRIVPFAVLAGVLALAAPRSASAGLQITPVFIGGTPPPATRVVGTGNLQDIFQVAAEAWERVFQRGGGNWKVTIYYGWTNSVGGNGDLFGQERMLAQGGKPVRITQSLILFNTNPKFDDVIRYYFLDPTPRDNSEYLRYTSERIDVDGGLLNTGRVFSNAEGDIAHSKDVLMLAMHEIGHSLGLDGDYSGFTNQFQQNLFIVVTPPRPFAGLHININNGPHLWIDTALMDQFVTDPGERRLISAIDALAIAQITSFDKPILDESSGQSVEQGEDQP